MSQLSFRGMLPSDEVRPSSDRKHPALWVRRLRVLRALTGGDQNIIRDVELRRGLNIIWAPPHHSANENALFQNGVAGHTAGKTTFCRLVRYVLGEHTFAPESTRRRLREKLSSGWVVADVVVNEETWTVARPLGIGPRSFCVRGAMIDEISNAGDRFDYQEFLKAIGAVTTERLPASRFPATDESLRWEHVLAWISRDQECRFADFLEWRHSSSDSESPFLSVEERQFVVRSMLGLISNEERLEQQINAQLLSQKRQAAEKEPFLDRQALTDHRRACNALGIELAPPSNPLFGYQARTEIDRRTAELREREKALMDSDRRMELRDLLERAISAQTNAQRDLADVEGRLDLEQGALQRLEGDAQTELLARLPPPTGYCMVPMSLARQRHCSLAVSVASDEISSDERTSEEEIEDQRRLVAGIKAAVAGAQTAFNLALETASRARHNHMAATTSFENQHAALLQEKARLEQIVRLVEEATAAWDEATAAAELVKRLDHEINESYTRQKDLRSDIQQALGRFSARFDYVIRAILGDEVSGRVDTSGRSLSLTVEEHGERDSAAVATVKLIAFDLAALTASAEGYGNFPRFLMHDGPREADMASDVYERVFLFARELERCFSGEPSFQYIVTTTTGPPDTFRGDPWLRLTLSGVPTEERFLRCDL